mmetsp:Transcript_45360/g.79263  ORF Transcript_45360/g.79263 Transcript_45360/m.79263 type:complete len:310 (+) Transcript_45360:445-1374(+)
MGRRRGKPGEQHALQVHSGVLGQQLRLLRHLCGHLGVDRTHRAHGVERDKRSFAYVHREGLDRHHHRGRGARRVLLLGIRGAPPVQPHSTRSLFRIGKHRRQLGELNVHHRRGGAVVLIVHHRMHQNVLAEQVSEGFGVGEHNVNVVVVVLVDSRVLLLQALGVEEVVGYSITRWGRRGGGSLLLLLLLLEREISDVSNGAIIQRMNGTRVGVDSVGPVGEQISAQTIVLLHELAVDWHHVGLLIHPRSMLAAASILHQGQECIQLSTAQKVSRILGISAAAVAAHVTAVVAVAHPGRVNHLVGTGAQT